MATSGRVWQGLAAGLVLLALLAAPPYLSSFMLSLLTQAIIYSILAMSLDLILGYTGLASLGHAAYFGLGAYSVGILSTRYGAGFWTTLAVGMLLAALSVLDLTMQAFLVGAATQRFGNRPVTVFGLAAGALSFLATGLAPGAAWFVAALIPASLMGLAEPTLKSMLSARVAETELGELQGALQSLASVAGIAGPLFFGWIYGVTSETVPGLAFAIGAGVLMLAAGCVGVGGEAQTGPSRQI